jgi:hypothetical protein
VIEGLSEGQFSIAMAKGLIRKNCPIPSFQVVQFERYEN